MTDAGLAHLKELMQLRRLHLKNSQVSDVGLGHLAALTRLELLTVSRQKVTDAGVLQLQQALPKIKIYYP